MYQTPTWLASALSERIIPDFNGDRSRVLNSGAASLDLFDALNSNGREIKVGMVNLGADSQDLDAELDRDWLEPLISLLNQADWIATLFPEVIKFLQPLLTKGKHYCCYSPPVLPPSINDTRDFYCDNNHLYIRSDLNTIDSNSLNFRVDREGSSSSQYGLSGQHWNGQGIKLDFTKHPYCQFQGIHLVGPNGGLMATGHCSLRLPFKVSGYIHLRLKLKSVSKTTESKLKLKLGEHTRVISVAPEQTLIQWGIQLNHPEDFIEFLLQAEDEPNWSGHNAISINSLEVTSKEFYAKSEDLIRLDGTIPTQSLLFYAHLNLGAGYDNWADLTNAFCIEFRDDPQCILLLTVPDIGEFIQMLLPHLERIGQYQCRVLVIEEVGGFNPGFIRECDYVLSCSAQPEELPKFMTALHLGKPLIAPRLNGLHHYVTEKIGFPFHCFRQAEMLNTKRKMSFNPYAYTPDWSSLCASLRDASNARLEITRYAELSLAATEFQAQSNDWKAWKDTHAEQTQ